MADLQAEFENYIRYKQKQVKATMSNVKPRFSAKLTEEEVRDLFLKYLEGEGWDVEEPVNLPELGYDILATKNKEACYFIVLSSKGTDTYQRKNGFNHSKNRIKLDFGSAIVKSLEWLHAKPNMMNSLVLPDDSTVFNAIGHLTEYLDSLDMDVYWVSADGSVEEGD